MRFGQFVMHNIVRDKESYIAYWLSSVFTVVIFFVFGVDRYHPELQRSRDVSDLLLYAQVVILIFAVGFLTISIHAFIQAKRHTYGMLRMMGMTKRQMGRMIVLENFLVGMTALVIGILIGAVFGHLSVMMMAKIIHLSHIQYVFPILAIRDTVLCFLLAFPAVSSLQARIINGKPIQELVSTRPNESKNMRFHPILAVLGILLLIFGYTLTFFHQLTFIEEFLKSHSLLEKSLEPMVIGTVCLGLYLVFREFLFLFLSWMRDSSKRYLKNGNAIWITGLRDTLKSAVGTLFISTILTTVAFAAIISCASVLSSVREDVTASNPIPIQYLSLKGNGEKEIRDVRLIDKKLKEHGIKYESYRYLLLEYGD